MAPNGSTHPIPAYKPNERLSWPGWLTCSKWITHNSGHPSAASRVQDRESSLARDRHSTNCDMQPTQETLQNKQIIPCRLLSGYAIIGFVTSRL